MISLVEQEIKELELKSKQLYEECQHKDMWSDPYKREIKRLRVFIELLKTGQDVIWYNDGCVIINDKFIYACITGKWRIAGKSKWYHSKNVKHFIENYLKHDCSYT